MRNKTPFAGRFLPVFFLFIIFVICIHSCRKNEYNFPLATEYQSVKTGNFFRVSANAGTEAFAIANKLKNMDAIKPFATEMADRIGYPFWANTVITESRDNTRLSGQGPDMKGKKDKKFIYTPMVKKEERRTKAVLLTTIDGADTSFRMLYPQQYKEFGFDMNSSDGWSARNLFAIFADFDYQLFGVEKWIVKDGRIFGREEKDMLIVSKSTGNTEGRSANVFDPTTAYMLPINICETWTSCVFATETPDGGGSCVTNTYCTTYWIETGSSSSGGGGDVITGGSGTGGNGTITDKPPCNNPIGPVMPVR